MIRAVSILVSRLCALFLVLVIGIAGPGGAALAAPAGHETSCESGSEAHDFVHHASHAMTTDDDASGAMDGAAGHDHAACTSHVCPAMTEAEVGAMHLLSLRALALRAGDAPFAHSVERESPQRPPRA